MWNAPRLRLVAAIVLLATVLATSLYWLRLGQTHKAWREQTLQQAARHAAQLAAAVADSQSGALGNVDYALQGLRAEYSAAPQRLDERAAHIVASFPAGMLRQIAVIGADGFLTYSSLDNTRRVYLGDREHFKVHAIRRSDQIYISEPVLGRVSGAWSIQFSRPVFRRGHFAGVMVFSIAPEYFVKRFTALQLGPNDSMALLRSDGRFLARNRLQGQTMGKLFDLNAPFRGLPVGGQGTFRMASALDQVSRVYAWQGLDVFSLIAVVGFDEHAILAPVERTIAASRQRNALGLLLLGGLAVAFCALLLQVARQLQALAESEARYRGPFAQSGSAMLPIDPADGRLIDADPAAAFYGPSHAVLAPLRLEQLDTLPPETLH
ncbi:MAG: hypothetical protein HYZ18_08225 [Pseudogulbenkiania sp.]|nr:hypothetical protein [Pseudogulbenkiania sp.]